MSPRIYKASQQTKTNIIQKATELFNESGTASLSMNALAEALGISAGNLRYHYKNKEEVVSAIQEQRTEEQEMLTQRLINSGGVRSDLSPEELHNVVLISWVLVHTWLPYAESTGQTINQAALEQAVEIMVQHYKPYL